VRKSARFDGFMLPRVSDEQHTISILQPFDERVHSLMFTPLASASDSSRAYSASFKGSRH
jgi:hypothetical protein